MIDGFHAGPVDAVEAAVAALHASAATKDATDWPQIVGLYEVLLRLHPTPVIELNHAVAVSMVDGPELYAARGHFLARIGRNGEARDAFRAALLSAKLEPERQLLTTRISQFKDLNGSNASMSATVRGRRGRVSGAS